MKLKLGVALFLAAYASVQALSNPDQHQMNVEVLTGPLCDTQEQVQHYIALYDGDPQTTINAVNAEEHDPQACGVASVAYVRGPHIGSGRGHDMVFRIVRILVLGVSTPNGISPVKAAPYFSVFGIRELAV
jgi:hypothetical protein